MKTQDYKIELTVEIEAVENNPRDWLNNAKRYLKVRIYAIGCKRLLAGTAPSMIKVYSTGVEPIDSAKSKSIKTNA